MTKAKLVCEMRRAQYRMGELPRYVIDQVPDDEWIRAYTTCSGCSARLCDPAEIDGHIAAATDFDDWWRRVTGDGHGH